MSRPRPISERAHAASPEGAAGKTVGRPALRWYGGKWRLAPWIIGHLPPHDAYCEPYGGAASVLLRKPPAKLETFNDLHGRLVNFFTVVREQADELVQAIELTPYARGEFQLAYQAASDPLEDARRFYVLACQGRGGAASGPSRTGWRTQRNPANTSPTGEFTAAHLGAVAARLKHVQIERDDALAVIGRYDHPATLHYVDPPYPRAVRSAGSSGRYVHDLSDADHGTLADVLYRVKGMVVLSGYPNDLYEALYPRWLRLDHQARDDAANLRVESLWLNPAAQQRARATTASNHPGTLPH